MSIVVAGIPAYNEERSIAQVILCAQRYVDFVIVCDDGSSDLTGEIASKLGAILIKHEKNLGKGEAIKDIFIQASKLNADFLVTLDGDGQHDPTEIPKLLETIKNGGKEKFDIMIGTRFHKLVPTEMPMYRRLGNKILNFFTNRALGYSKGKNTGRVKITDSQSGFRIYSRKAINQLYIGERSIGVDSCILLDGYQKNLKIGEVPIFCDYNGAKSSHNPIEQTLIVIVSIVKYISVKRPLLSLGVPGVIFIGMGGLFGLWMLKLYTTEQRIILSIALASMGFLLLGALTIFTSFILYTLSAIEKLFEKFFSSR